MITGHLLSAADLTKESALSLLSTAKELAQITDGPNKKLPTLRGKTVVISFLKIPPVLESVLKLLLRGYRRM